MKKEGAVLPEEGIARYLMLKVITIALSAWDEGALGFGNKLMKA